ncbi:MAG: hypothetical protein QM535_14995 [Limnohabitans sp.]|nr:hypothetical protein [Limnohabitans sp.]
MKIFKEDASNGLITSLYDSMKTLKHDINKQIQLVKYNGDYFDYANKNFLYKLEDDKYLISPRVLELFKCAENIYTTVSQNTEISRDVNNMLKTFEVILVSGRDCIYTFDRKKMTLDDFIDEVYQKVGKRSVYFEPSVSYVNNDLNITMTQISDNERHMLTEESLLFDYIFTLKLIYRQYTRTNFGVSVVLKGFLDKIFSEENVNNKNYDMYKNGAINFFASMVAKGTDDKVRSIISDNEDSEYESNDTYYKKRKKAIKKPKTFNKRKFFIGVFLGILLTGIFFFSNNWLEKY